MIAHNALFRCPVVSRKHAKITFTEYGNVYITDLHSHHGTHIIRPNEMVAKTLEPETATVLADGDVLIFGKSVGRDNDLVLPITVRVKLLFVPLSDNVPLPPPERISFSPDTTLSEKSPAPGTSGRYGIYVSSDSSASSSDGDSDIEEIPPPPGFSPRLRTATSQSSQTSSISGRLQLLRNLLPAVPSSCVDEPAPTAFAQLLATPTLGATGADIMPGALDADSPSASDSSFEPDVQEDDDHSMNEPAFEPAQAQFDGWHGLYDPPSPRPQGNDFEVSSIPSLQVEAQACIARIFTEPFPSQPSIHPVNPQATPTAPSAVSLTGLEDHMLAAREDISLLRQIRNTDEERFEAHVCEVKARLAALDEAIHMPAVHNPEHDAALVDVVARMNTLQGKMSALEHQAAEAGPREELSADLKEIKAMLEEIKMIRENSVKQIAFELEAAQAARAQAEAAAAEAVARLISNPLKRKRSEEDDCAEDEAGGAARVVAPVPKRRRTTHRVAKVLVRAATAATVGAVAAWTALAFA
ncbi:hypothetical protein DAEQUDRAFT_730444 [Daedalea quercina L-15889]|uniref:FHA domain-containing protein n=1 Tax=Daedalea quercina L-15889 TaxID=1314783 RepID=A0A165MZK7_9APHY|nr:hypothetical protein DAEQUDRAFT_730444 [Daedalea quercina L-15889]